MMKILYISNNDDKYGAPRSLYFLIKHLKSDYGIFPIVITSKNNNLNKLCNDVEIENYFFSYGSWFYKRKSFFKKPLKIIINYFRNNRAIKKIEDVIDLKKIDMIHSNISVIDIGAYIAKKYKIQHVMHLRELDILKGIVPINKKSIKIINENTVKFIAISNAVKRYWMHIGIDQSKIVVIYNGIYKDIKTSILKKAKKNDKMIKIIFAGSSAPHKGHSDLLNAIEILINKNIDNFHVYWYGDVTNYSSYLLTELRKKKLDRYISFLGFNENLFNDMSSYDIGIVCSRAEAFGRITVEYMLSRVFVIASDTGANPEIIDNDITGLLYQQNNSSDLADKMEFIFNNNKKLSEMVDMAYEKALKKFTSEKNAEEIYQLYSSMNINI